MRSFTFFIFGLLFCVLPAAVSAQPTVPAIVNLINNERQKVGLSVLNMDDRLNIAAEIKAQEIASIENLVHTKSSKDMPWPIMEGVGYSYKIVGENLIVGFNTNDEIVKTWMNSRVHRNNILSIEYTDTGIGIALGRYKGYPAYYVVEYFATPLLNEDSNGVEVDSLDIRQLKIVISNLLALVNEYTFKINSLYAR